MTKTRRRWIWPFGISLTVVAATGVGFWLGGDGHRPLVAQETAVAPATVVDTDAEAAHDLLQNPDGSWKYTNALIDEASPYLQLHAHNPVDWRAWGPEALQEARRLDRPIFLSVGYSTCYWCHVMERQVFSNPEIAELMNRWFVNIKLDREERPDLDQIYMIATQLVSGHGGWPNSIFMTPELKPFFAGTYFPPTDAPGLPGFPRILAVLNQYWTERREEVDAQADQITAAIRQYETERQAPPMAPDSVLFNRAIAGIKGRYDAMGGGFGGAPKFPPCIQLDFLLNTHKSSGDTVALDMVRHTLSKMSRGGVYDQVGGGFHRYATDANWLVPHFEKMLYNQAHLAHLYTAVYRVTGEQVWSSVAEDIMRYVEREMTDPEGGFYSALDAETETVEGKYYLWEEAAIRELLGRDSELFFEVYDLVSVPKGEGEILYVPRPLAQVAADLEIDVVQLAERMSELRRRLLEQRSTRTYPLLDDKILASWNGMMITSYAYAYQVLQVEAYRQAAEGAAAFVLGRMRNADGELGRSYRHGALKKEGYLEDYAFMTQGLLALYRATGEQRWLKESRELADLMIARFWDEEEHGFFFTAHGTDLIARIKNAQDAALPSANAVAVHSLLDLAQITGQKEYLDKAAQTLFAFGGMAQANPTAFIHMIAAAHKYTQTDWGIVTKERMPASVAGRQPKIQTDPPKITLLQSMAELSDASPVPGESFQVSVHLDIDEGWHINANPASKEMLIPTSLILNATLPFEVLAVDYPDADRLYVAAVGETLAVYEGRVTVRAEARLSPGLPAGTTGEMRLLVQYQACDDQRCLPPDELASVVPIEVGTP